MQLHQVQLAKPITVLPARLADIEVELGISDFQRHLWDAFFDVYETTWHALEAAQNPGTIDHEDSAPGLTNVLEARHSRVMTEQKMLRNLLEIARLLYSALTPQQRLRADRLLVPLCNRCFANRGPAC